MDAVPMREPTPGAAWRIVSGAYEGSWLFIRQDGRADLVKPLTDEEAHDLVGHVAPPIRELLRDELRPLLRVLE